jgi:hypothetical protein
VVTYASLSPAQREAAKIRLQRWRKANPGKVRAQTARHSAAHPNRAREYRKGNRDEINRRARVRRRKDPQTLQREAEYRDTHREELRQRGQEWRTANADRNQAHQAGYRQACRDLVFDFYGRECACCGAAEHLSIDHIDGDGRAHRLALFGRDAGSTMQFYVWLIDNGFPDGYQTLCRRCNASKGQSAACRIAHREVAA